jgi:IS1 family transposase
LTRDTYEPILYPVNKLTPARRAAVLTALVEGNSVRSTVRITGVAKNMVTKLLEIAGQVAADYQNQTLRNLTCKRIQCDEIWSFVYGKDRNITPAIRDRAPSLVGSAWTWTAIDADTKLMLSWMVGQRDEWTAESFIRDLAGRLSGRVQMTTDGLKLYINAIEGLHLAARSITPCLESSMARQVTISAPRRGIRPGASQEQNSSR